MLTNGKKKHLPGRGWTVRGNEEGKNMCTVYIHEIYEIGGRGMEFRRRIVEKEKHIESVAQVFLGV